MFDDDHGVRVRQRGRQHPAGIVDRRRGNDLQPRDVGVPAFQAVRVLRCELPPGTGGHPDHDWHRELSARHVSKSGRGVDNLVECQQAEVDGHDLDDRAEPSEGCADACPNEARL